MDKEERRRQIIEDYRAAFAAANKFDVDLEYERGWYVLLQGGMPFRFREKEIIAMTAQLNARADNQNPNRRNQS